MMIQEKNATNGAMNGSSEEIAEEREESARARARGQRVSTRRKTHVRFGGSQSAIFAARRIATARPAVKSVHVKT